MSLAQREGVRGRIGFVYHGMHTALIREKGVIFRTRGLLSAFMNPLKLYRNSWIGRNGSGLSEEQRMNIYTRNTRITVNKL